MITLTQLIKRNRSSRRTKTRMRKHHFCRSKALHNRPQLKGFCTRVYTTKPKKPNSSQRKVAKVRLSIKRHVLICIPGMGHNLQNYSVVLIRGGRPRDIPGVHYYAIRGKFSFIFREKFERSSARSKHGLKHNKNRIFH